MKIRDILERKGRQVVTVDEDRTVLEAARTLAHHNIGSLLVTRDDRPEGIITERDVLNLVAASPASLESTTVGSVMTRELIVAHPADELHAMMGVMTKQRIRHLPVVENDRVVGLVSIGDLLNACRVIAEEENVHLRRYIHGGA
jgi:CBS domain-containing protein